MPKKTTVQLIFYNREWLRDQAFVKRVSKRTIINDALTLLALVHDKAVLDKVFPGEADRIADTLLEYVRNRREDNPRRPPTG